jgi:hypothetical protein
VCWLEGVVSWMSYSDWNILLRKIYANSDSSRNRCCQLLESELHVSLDVDTVWTTKCWELQRFVDGCHSRYAEVKKLAINYNEWLRDREFCYPEVEIYFLRIPHISGEYLEELKFVMEWDNGIKKVMVETMQLYPHAWFPKKLVGGLRSR